MEYGLEWVDPTGRTITENIKPLMLLGSVVLRTKDIGKNISVQFNTGGLKPYWVPVIRTGHHSLGSLMLQKSDLSLNGHQATYTFMATATPLGAAEDASITIYYGVH